MYIKTEIIHFPRQTAWLQTDSFFYTLITSIKPEKVKLMKVFAISCAKRGN
jgi:hypothetical protein